MSGLYAMATYPLDRALLAQLAPLQMPNYRQQRFSGDDLRVPIEAFAPADREVAQHIYRELSQLMALLKQHWHDNEEALEAVKRYLSAVRWTDVIQKVRSFGTASVGAEPQHLIKRVVHDVRGGSFMALSICLQLIEMGLDDAVDGSRLFYLTRDHLKIMRNALVHLDPVGEARDAMENHHDIDLIVEKWHSAVYRVADDVIATIQVETDYHGSISESCLESAALDRVLYNLINNAVRFASDQNIHVWIFPLDDGEVLRFVVYNRCSAAHWRVLNERFPSDLSAVFLREFTTGGSGLGLRICAEFVTNAFGLANPEQGIRQGYFGARQLGDSYVAWIHWPTAGH